jgi:hypothetical protein
MRNFTIVNNEWTRLLENVNTSALQVFLDQYQTDIIENEKFHTSDEVCEYFQLRITDAIVPDFAKWIARSQVSSYMKGYTLMEEIYNENMPELCENRPPIYEILWVPQNWFDLWSSFSDIFTKLLLQNPWIPGMFLVDYSPEMQIRAIEAYVAMKPYALWMNDDGDYTWLSSDSFFTVGQNIHGDVYFSKHRKIDGSVQQDLFSLPSTDTIEGDIYESLYIYQYTNNLVATICRYALLTGYIPEELRNWRQIMNTTKSLIPNATVSDGIDQDPEHIALMSGWKDWRGERSIDGAYEYLGNSIYSQPWWENHVTALICGDTLFFAKKDPSGDIEFSFWDEVKNVRFRKTFEFKQEDIGRALLALFHLPGRSSSDNRKILTAFDWAKENGCLHNNYY